VKRECYGDINEVSAAQVGGCGSWFDVLFEEGCRDCIHHSITKKKASGALMPEAYPNIFCFTMFTDASRDLLVLVAGQSGAHIPDSLHGLDFPCGTTASTDHAIDLSASTAKQN